MFSNWPGMTLTFVIALMSCKKTEDNSQTPAIPFSAVVSFGDSLSDAGTYQVGPIKAAGGGLFTVNGIGSEPGTDPVPSFTWSQLVSAATLGRVSCAARHGGFGSPISNEPAVGDQKCRNYAQGGARVTDPKGVGNPVGVGFTTGPLTEPVITQIAHFREDNGSEDFAGTELITILAGANDLFAEIDALTAEAKSAGAAAFAKSVVTQLMEAVPAASKPQAQVAIAQALQVEAVKPDATPTSILTGAVKAATPFLTAAINPVDIGKKAETSALEAGKTYAATTGIQKASQNLATVATALTGYVKGMIAKGARYVIVVNIPDVSQTPLGARSPDSQPLIQAMVTAFNSTLAKTLTDIPEALLVDAFSENQRQFLDPAHYDLDNVKDTACNLTFPANILDTTKDGSGSSVVCSGRNLIEGDTSHYLFADKVHPTPYGHKLLAQYVTKAMVLAGWL